MINYDEICILYEDNHLLVVEKPVNIPSQEDRTRDKDMLNLLKEYIKIKYEKPGNVYLGLVHRLDRPVGGVMVFAKTSKAASRLSEQIQTRSFEKEYIAVIHGQLAKARGTLEHYLLKDNHTNTVRAVDKDTEGAKKAILKYELTQQVSNLSLVKIWLLTGRSHQIRVQFASIGHPLYGDQKYGVDKNQPGQQIALWSSKVGLTHPTLREFMCFTSLPPCQDPWNLFQSYLYG